MKGDSTKIREYINQYGSEFCVDAIQRAISVDEARHMRIRNLTLNRIDKKEAESRILAMASELRLRIGK